MADTKKPVPGSTSSKPTPAAPKLIDRKAAATPSRAPSKPGAAKSTPATSRPGTASKPAVRPATTSKPAAKAISKPASKPGTTSKPAAKSASRPKAAPAPANNMFTKAAAEPERIGEWLYNRAQWADEIVAILIIVGGVISLFSLVNTTPSAALANSWAGLLRSWFGQVGGVLISLMVISAGLLIVLPKVKIRVPMTWRRFIFIELSFVAFLALLHLLARDPEPRALARDGGGGGYVGWALSTVVQKPFGTNFAIFLYGACTIIFLAVAFGATRMHIRQALIFARGRMSATAEWLTKERPPRPRRVKQPKQPMAAPVSVPAMAQPLAAEPVLQVQAPIAVYAPVTQETYQPATDARAAYLAPDTPPRPVNPRTRSKPPAAVYNLETPTLEPEIAAPAPVVEERKRRYFVVDDFREDRATLPRDPALPSMELLHDTELNRPTEQEINTNVRIIENTLLEFDIDVEVVDVKVGPTVTLYAVQPFREVVDEQGRVTLQRVRVNKIASLGSDLSLALSSKTLRIQPYVPGHSYMGIEVPNRKPSTVGLRPVMESEGFARSFRVKDPDNAGQMIDRPLVVPLGRDVSGAAFSADLATMPHVLIAGTTGSGKSVCITALAVSLIMNNHPDRLRLVMLDPKMVELTRFNGIPHLLGPVETEIERIIGVLRWATREMDRRYKLLEGEAARNIGSYNQMVAKRKTGDPLPYIVIMIDEIGDLMLTRPEETERTITRLAQMARAVGMHLVVATQRPSVDIITGLIKANFPSRISFAVASGIDSRVILDAVGAETLMGRGDMLFQASDAAGPQRLQGCFVSDAEIDAIVGYWKDWRVEKRASGEWDTPSVGPWDMGLTRRESHGKDEPLLEDAISIAVREGQISIGALQKQLGVDLRHATKLIDLMQDLGILGQSKDGGRAREVTLKPGTDQYRKIMNRKLGGV
jgi:DNA segregation ATPase FtsK/SpoIIIE-like protein